MPIASQKIVQSYIQALLPEIVKAESANSNLILWRQKKQNHEPSLADSNLTSQQDKDIDAFSQGLNTFLAAHAAIIATLKAKDQPSHGTRSLD